MNLKRCRYAVFFYITIHQRSRLSASRNRRSNYFRPSQSVSVRCILILSSHLILGLPSGHLQRGFTTVILYVFVFFPSHLTIRGADGLQIWTVAVTMLSKESQTADSGWSSRLVAIFTVKYCRETFKMTPELN
jgi:hypothetical protein